MPALDLAGSVRSELVMTVMILLLGLGGAHAQRLSPDR
jgi:hypothetical protein